VARREKLLLKAFALFARAEEFLIHLRIIKT
jgi:hypothetical protein